MQETTSGCGSPAANSKYAVLPSCLAACSVARICALRSLVKKLAGRVTALWEAVVCAMKSSLTASNSRLSNPATVWLGNPFNLTASKEAAGSTSPVKLFLIRGYVCSVPQHDALRNAFFTKSVLRSRGRRGCGSRALPRSRACRLSKTQCGSGTSHLSRRRGVG